METSVRSKEMDMLNGGLAGKLILFDTISVQRCFAAAVFNSAGRCCCAEKKICRTRRWQPMGSCVALVGIFVNLIVDSARRGIRIPALATLLVQKNAGIESTA
ncbi:MAG: hypothetical protein ACLU48_04495 [Clostridiaceae bacterium]